MTTSSNGNIFRVTGHLCGEFIGPGGFPTQRPVTRSFDVFFHLRLNKRLSKQSWGWWFETLSRPLWRHCNEVRRLGSILCCCVLQNLSYVFVWCFLSCVLLTKSVWLQHCRWVWTDNTLKLFENTFWCLNDVYIVSVMYIIHYQISITKEHFAKWKSFSVHTHTYIYIY